jgi:hypothetical protein
MKRLNEIVLILACLVRSLHAEEYKPIREFALDEHIVYTIPISSNRVTTISFPGPIGGIDAAQVTVDGKTPAAFHIHHTKGSYFFSVRALGKKTTTNLNIRWNQRTYVLELVESSEPFYSVIFQIAPEPVPIREAPRVTPARLMTLLDKAKAYPLLKAYHSETVANVEYLRYAKVPRVMDYGDYTIQIEEVFRFDAEDTLIFRLVLRNKTIQPLHHRPDGFSVRVGERAYFQSISDSSGVIPPKGEAPAWFAITGTPNGGRNELSLKNEFIVLLEAAPAKPSAPQKDK